MGRRLVGQLAYDRALFFDIACQRLLALSQIVSEGSAKLLELLQACVDIRELPRQHSLNLATPIAPAPVLEPQQIAYLAQSQPMQLRLLDELEASERPGRIEPKAATGPAGPRHQTDALVVSQRIATHAALLRQLTDPERVRLSHDL